MVDVRTKVIATLDEMAGLSDHPSAPAGLSKGKDFDLSLLEMDSLTLTEVAMELEEAFDLELDLDELTEHKSLNQMVAFLEERVQGSSVSA